MQPLLPTTSRYYPLWTQFFLFFAAATVFLVACGYNMIIDSDPLWHVATGDLIRQSGMIPAHDPWSFTAGDTRWLNVSWLWDSAFSYIVERFGWGGAAAVNATLIATMLALIYTHCLLRTGNGLASFFTLFLLFIILLLHMRPVHITHMMVALWMLLLGLYIRGECRPAWLLALPVSMLMWVNMHGGFVVGPVLAGVFFLDSVRRKDRAQTRWLLIILALCGMATLCNPNGILIIETVMRPLFTVANQYIAEWRPVTINGSFFLSGLFVILFVALVIGRPTCATPPEKWLAYAFLAYGLYTSRALSIFTIIAAPMLTYKLSEYIRDTGTATAKAMALRVWASARLLERQTLLAALLLAACAKLLVVQPVFLKLFPQQTDWPTLKEEITYIRSHYPKGHFITDFDLGGYIIYETRGKLPTFIDPRTETVFPPKVMEDYFAFRNAEPGWESILDTYHIDGILLANHQSPAMFERFTHNTRWKQAFKGPTATVFVRQ